MGLAGAPAAALLVLVLAGCGAAVKPGAAGLSPSTTTTAVTAGGAGTTSTTVAGHGGSATTTPATTAAGKSGGSSPAGGTSPTGPAPASAGTYTYDQQGSFSALGSTQSFPPQGTDVAEAATATGPGSWTQLWHSYLAAGQAPDDTTFSITPAGYAISSEVIRMSAGSQTVTFTCTFSSPIEVLDWPPTVGHQFSGSGSCTSSGNSYGSFDVAVSGSVTGTQTTSIGGPSTTAYVLSTKVTTSGSVDSTGSETDWFDPGPDLDLYVTSQQSGTYDGIQFSSSYTRTLTSTRPG